jgi:hypothetical protein
VCVENACALRRTQGVFTLLTSFQSAEPPARWTDRILTAKGKPAEPTPGWSILFYRIPPLPQNAEFEKLRKDTASLGHKPLLN